MNQRSLHTGFTLTELMVTLSISAILLTVATPTFESVIKGNQVVSHARDLASALSYARSEAISRGDEIGVCGTVDGVSCNGSNNWSGGWLVFVDDGMGGGTAYDSLRTGNEELLTVYKHDGTNLLEVFDSGGATLSAIGFKARGPLRQNDSVTLRICEADREIKYARAVLLGRTGRVSRSFDIHDGVGNSSADSIYEDVNGNNLTCL